MKSSDFCPSRFTEHYEKGTSCFVDGGLRLRQVDPGGKAGLGGEVYGLSEGLLGDGHVVDRVQLCHVILHPELLRSSWDYVDQKAGAVLQYVYEHGLELRVGLVCYLEQHPEFLGYAEG